MAEKRPKDTKSAPSQAGPRKRGPPKREVQYTRALYRFRTDQLEALRRAAGQRAAQGGSYDISIILRALVDDWMKKGASLPKRLDDET